MEWMESLRQQHALSKLSGGQTYVRRRAKSEAEVGIRVRWRYHGIRTADHPRRKSVHWECGRRDPRTGREDRLHPLDIRREGAGAVVDSGGCQGQGLLAAVRRSARVVLFAGRGHRKRTVEEKNR